MPEETEITDAGSLLTLRLSVFMLPDWQPGLACPPIADAFYLIGKTTTRSE